MVVVLATPPFWLANAITFADTGGSVCSRKTFAPVFAWAAAIPSWRARPPPGGMRARGRRRPQTTVGEPLTLRPHVPLLDRRLIFVTGKGGVGKSTVALALGLLAARRGRRTIVAELAGEPPAAGVRSDGHRFEETPLRRAVHDLDRPRARDGGIPARQDRTGRSRARAHAAVPGAGDGDSRHAGAAVGREGLGARAARAADPRRRSARPRHRRRARDRPRDRPAPHAADVRRDRTGRPDRHQGARSRATIADRSFTAILAVSTPEEMPVNETLSLHAALQRTASTSTRSSSTPATPTASPLPRAGPRRGGVAGGRRREPCGAARSAVRAGAGGRPGRQQQRLEESFPGPRRPSVPVRSRARPRRARGARRRARGSADMNVPEDQLT